MKMNKSHNIPLIMIIHCHLIYFALQRNSVGSNNPCDCFQFEVEERIQCVQSKAVRYKNKTDYILALPIPMEAATNKGMFQNHQIFVISISHWLCTRAEFGTVPQVHKICQNCENGHFPNSFFSLVVNYLSNSFLFCLMMLHL